MGGNGFPCVTHAFAVVEAVKQGLLGKRMRFTLPRLTAEFKARACEGTTARQFACSGLKARVESSKRALVSQMMRIR